MKFFETIKLNLDKCGYSPNPTRSFYTKRLLIGLRAFLTVLSNFIFFFYKADNIEQYINAAYFITSNFGIFLSLIHTSSKTAAIFITIDEFEKSVRDSE